MPKRYPQQARELAVQLYLSGLSVPAITERFNEGTAGLLGKEEKPLPINITERRVAEYVAEHKAKNGPRPEPEDEELSVDSIARVKQRALNVLAREIAYLEQLPKGRISPKQSTALRQHYATLDDMERRQETAEKRKSKGKGRAGKAPASAGKSESAIDALAKVEGEVQPGGFIDYQIKHKDDPGDVGPGPTKAQSQEAYDAAVNAVRKDAGFPPRGLSPEELEEIKGSARA